MRELAIIHAHWESPSATAAQPDMRAALVHETRLLRGFQSLFCEWFDGLVPTDETPAVRQQKDQFAAHRRHAYETFVNALPNADRTRWVSAMAHCDSLVERVGRLPKTLLHGDLNWRNIGMMESDGTRGFVLIDWEGATYGLHSLDVVGLLFNPVLSADEFDSLVADYYAAYRGSGGHLLGEDTWSDAVDLAVAWIAITRLPFKYHIVKAKGHDRDDANIELLVARARRALDRVA